MPRSKIPVTQRARNAGISLPLTLIRRATRLAAKRNRSLSGLTNDLLKRELEQAEVAEVNK